MHISDGVRAKVFIRAKPFIIQNQTFLRLQQLKMDFSVQNIRMGVENVHDGNTILRKLPILLHKLRIGFYSYTTFMHILTML